MFVCCTQGKRQTKPEILFLNFKKEWFDKIMNLEKGEEYRDRTRYYFSRIWRKKDSIKKIWMMNGMHKNARQMLVKLNGIVLETDRYVLKLGEIISKDNKEIDDLVHY